jgi:hypothetical protein
MDGRQQLRSLLIASKPGRALTARFMGVAASVQPKEAFPAVRDDRGAGLIAIGEDQLGFAASFAYRPAICVTHCRTLSLTWGGSITSTQGPMLTRKGTSCTVTGTWAVTSYQVRSVSAFSVCCAVRGRSLKW